MSYQQNNFTSTQVRAFVPEITFNLNNGEALDLLIYDHAAQSFQINEAAMEQQRAQQQAQRPKEGVHVDFIPKKSPQKMKKDIEGGEYVDYEEVKD